MSHPLAASPLGRGVLSAGAESPRAPASPAPLSRPEPGAAAAVPAARGAGIYVHFPWCLAKCPYCDFVSYVAPSIDHAGYADAVLRELDARAEAFRGRRVDSIFFGGGTPSLWKASELGRVLDGIKHRWDARAPLFPKEATCAPVEVTVECNPTSLDDDNARRLLDLGVNRLSIGVQSLRDDRLAFLGRLHDAAGARAAVRSAISAGIPRVSADLIFGLPGQSPSEARDEAIELAGLGVAHVSCYQLTIEAGTRFGELSRRGRLPLADDGEVADAFVAIEEALGPLGFRHYEISNYARPCEEARHNLGYWRGDDYLGLGCGAYGFLRETSESGGLRVPARGVRWRNEVRPERYVERSTEVASAGAVIEALDAETLMRERIMLGLRVDEGIDIEATAFDLGVDAWPEERRRAAEWLEARGRVERQGSRLRVPRSAWLWTDDTAARLF